MRWRGATSSALPFNVSDFLSLVTPIENSSPSRNREARVRRSDGEETLDPFKVVMTSPAFTPALDAGESDVTEVTSTPSFTPK